MGCGVAGCDCRHKDTPRSEAELRQLQNRLKRMIGQLGALVKCWRKTATAAIS